MLERTEEHERRLNEHERKHSDHEHRFELIEGKADVLERSIAQLNKTLIKRMAHEAEVMKLMTRMHLDIQKLLRRKDG